MQTISIEIIDLLHQREVEFMRIWRCEQEIRSILSLDNFPFPPPPDLPSRESRAVSKARKPAAHKPQKAGFEIRKLNPETENAYRLVFAYNGTEDSSFHKDRELVRMLVNMHSTDFILKSVEAVRFTDLEKWDVTELLWSSQDANGGGNAAAEQDRGTQEGAEAARGNGT